MCNRVALRNERIYLTECPECSEHATRGSFQPLPSALLNDQGHTITTVINRLPSLRLTLKCPHAFPSRPWLSIPSTQSSAHSSSAIGLCLCLNGGSSRSITYVQNLSPGGHSLLWNAEWSKTPFSFKVLPRLLRNKQNMPYDKNVLSGVIISRTVTRVFFLSVLICSLMETFTCGWYSPLPLSLILSALGGKKNKHCYFHFKDNKEKENTPQKTK